MPVCATEHKVAGNSTHFSAPPFCPGAALEQPWSNRAICPIPPAFNASSEKVTESLMPLNGQGIEERPAAQASNVASLSMRRTVYSVWLNGVSLLTDPPAGQTTGGSFYR